MTFTQLIYSIVATIIGFVVLWLVLKLAIWLLDIVIIIACAYVVIRLIQAYLATRHHAPRVHRLRREK